MQRRIDHAPVSSHPDDRAEIHHAVRHVRLADGSPHDRATAGARGVFDDEAGGEIAHDRAPVGRIENQRRPGPAHPRPDHTERRAPQTRACSPPQSACRSRLPTPAGPRPGLPRFRARRPTSALPCRGRRDVPAPVPERAETGRPASTPGPTRRTPSARASAGMITPPAPRTVSRATRKRHLRIASTSTAGSVSTLSRCRSMAPVSAVTPGASPVLRAPSSLPLAAQSRTRIPSAPSRKIPSPPMNFRAFHSLGLWLAVTAMPPPAWWNVTAS